VAGRDLAGCGPAARARLGLARTLQGLAVVPELDVMANLLLGRHRIGRAGLVRAALRLRAVRAEEAHAARRCREIAEEVGLAAQLATPAQRLPLGARKRLELGRALAMDPVVLMLDEPFAGAGPDDLSVLIAATRRAVHSGVAVLVVDHDLGTVLGSRGVAGAGEGTRGQGAGPASTNGERGQGGSTPRAEAAPSRSDGRQALADRAVVLDAGRVVASGRPSEVQRHPAAVSAYLGPAPGRHRPPVRS
jgi:ABC-type branched-subunit amino acid transport system ATPase component